MVKVLIGVAFWGWALIRGRHVSDSLRLFKEIRYGGHLWVMSTLFRFNGCYIAVDARCRFNLDKTSILHRQCPIDLLYTLKRHRVSTQITLHKKWNFPLRTYSVNVTNSAVPCRFGQIYWCKTSIFVQQLWLNSKRTLDCFLWK